MGPWGWIVGAILVLLPLFVVAVKTTNGRESLRSLLRELPAWALQVLTFLLVLGFCLLVPAVTLYYGANVKAVVSDITDGNATTADYLTLVCRTMQLVLISVASLLPALMFYQFDRDRLSTLREKFEQQIFRLDPTMKTSLDIDAKYGRQIDEIYGRERPGRSSRLQPGRRTPIFVATVLIMLGWLLVLLNPDVGLVDSEDEIAELFDPGKPHPHSRFSARTSSRCSPSCAATCGGTFARSRTATSASGSSPSSSSPGYSISMFVDDSSRPARVRVHRRDRPAGCAEQVARAIAERLGGSSA